MYNSLEECMKEIMLLMHNVTMDRLFYSKGLLQLIVLNRLMTQTENIIFSQRQV